MDEYKKLVSDLQKISKGLYEDDARKCAQRVFDAANTIEKLFNILKYNAVSIEGEYMTVLEALDKLRRERNFAMQYVPRCCETCYGEDMEHDEVDCPCWNCKGGYSEWALKEIK